MCYDESRRGLYDPLLPPPYGNYETRIVEECFTIARDRFDKDSDKMKLAEEYLNLVKTQTKVFDIYTVKSYLDDVGNSFISPQNAAILVSTNTPAIQRGQNKESSFAEQSLPSSWRRNASTVKDFATNASRELMHQFRNNFDRFDINTVNKTEILAATDKHDAGLKAVSAYITALRQEGHEKAFKIAETWGNKPGLSPQAVAHGVAYEMQKNLGSTYAFEDGKHTTVDPGVEYAMLYQERKADDIKNGSMPSAKDLFD